MTETTHTLPAAMTTATQRLNALVREFDEATGFRFDRITEPSYLFRLARCFHIRESFDEELGAAFRAVREEAKP